MSKHRSLNPPQPGSPDALDESRWLEGPGGRPEALPVIPLRGSVLFPGAIVPVIVGRKSSQKLIADLTEGDSGRRRRSQSRRQPADSESSRIVVVASLRDNNIEEPERDDLMTTATAARILKVVRLPNGNLNLIVEGLDRVRLLEYLTWESPYPTATYEMLPDDGADVSAEDDNGAVKASLVSARKLLDRLKELTNSLPEEIADLVERATTTGALADTIAAHLGTTVNQKQQILETVSATERLRLVLDQVAQQIHIQELAQKIDSEVQGEINRGQREAYLRERLRAIKRELGEDQEDAEIEELSKRIEDSGMSDEVRETAQQELDRLGRMTPAAAEYHVSRSYIDWLLDVPWGVYTDDNLELCAARELLDKDHYDLEKVKTRIIEYLAVRKLKPDKKGPIICFIGPPGVGKTSLGRSIAKALGRKFVRLSLGGVHDEAEIRGHRRTYVGALPGRIVQGIKRAGSMNPVFMLDELDKVGNDFRGDPSAALLEVLDPEQNSTFSDHYLEVELDLSRVLFIATANVAENMPDVLRDRMELLELPGYTAEEKVHIAQRYLVPRQRDEHGLTAEQVDYNDEAIMAIVRDYTSEAGVRELERQIATIYRRVARRVAEGLDEGTKAAAVGVTPALLHDFLGPVKYFNEVADRTATPGVAVGLAWTAVGGDILFIEATRMRGKGVLKLTGQLGEVMKESAQTAMSYLRSRATSLDIDDDVFTSHDVHIHVPAGATPKDGPSAGVTILAALASLFTGRTVAADLGLTGELTLRGMVLPVGGIKNKVLAARRAGLARVLLPAKNEKDLEEVPAVVREGLEFVFVERVDQVLEHALLPAIDKPRPALSKRASAKTAKKKVVRRAGSQLS